MTWSEAQKRYQNSLKGKLARKKYQQSDKARETQKKYREKRRAKLLGIKTTQPNIDPV